ncbi:MAG: alpha-amylase family glycosyl hydrolase [Akkermansia sp.]
MTFGRVTGNNAVTWEPDRCDWYETVKLNYGYNFLAGLPALRLLPDWTSPKQKVPKTWRIMDDILSFWQGLGIGGFRCDMAQMIPMAFWKWAIARSRVRLPDVFFMAEAYNDHLKTTPGDPCTALLESGFNAVYDADCYHLAEHVYTRGNWANDFDRLFRSEPQYLTHGVRYVENHDEKRVCSPIAWGGTGRTILPAIMTLVYASGKGPVLVYNGQEVGNARKLRAALAAITAGPASLTIPACRSCSPGWPAAGLTPPCWTRIPRN